MKVVLMAATIVIAGTVNAFAGSETDRALGAGSYVHPTGPVKGIWK